MPVPDLGDPKRTREIIQKYHFTFQKKFGQNFLIDPRVLQKIVAAAGITKEDMVVEVGPGIGTLTQVLAAAAREVAAVEIDRKLLPILEETLAGYDNVNVIHADILKVDMAELAKERNGSRPVKVVANLPYYITTPIIMGLLESHAPMESMTVMIQKEVADRMKAGPGSKDYGALSLAVAYYADTYLAANVPPNCFMPRPNVDSAVVTLTLHKVPPVAVADEALLFKLIRASFNQRRKTLVNGLVNSSELDFGKEEVLGALREMNKPDSVRGETFTLAEFAALSDTLQKNRGL